MYRSVTALTFTYTNSFSVIKRQFKSPIEDTGARDSAVG